jgi:hypothetical protein
LKIIPAKYIFIYKEESGRMSSGVFISLNIGLENSIPIIDTIPPQIREKGIAV